MNDHAEDHAKSCPLEAVHRRLGDLHRQWHAAEKAYFDPEEFRVAIQAAIQTSRTVTFILQKNKDAIPDFASWYEKWRKEFASIPLMGWMKNARNKIEKQGDLEAHSFIKAEIVASYLNNGPKIVVPAKLSDAPLKLVKSIPDNAIGDHIRKDGVVRIERRWVENTLPEFELLDAVARAYGHQSRMLDDAHKQLGIPTGAVNVRTGEHFDKESMAGRLPCMIGHSDLRTLDVWLADGKPVEFETIHKTMSAAEGQQASKRYAFKPEEIFGKGESAEATLEATFATATKMFERDGYHITIMFFLKGGKLVHFVELRPHEHGQKYLMMRSMAHELVRHGADGAILVGEVWRAPFDNSAPYRRAADAPDREEALNATLVTKTGEPILLTATIRREADKVKLCDKQRLDGGAQFMFAPIYEAWGREIPAEWADQEKAASDGGEKS